MTTRVNAGQRIRHVIDVVPWLLRGNDDAPVPGRVLVLAGCAGCELGARLALWAGTWHVEHDHGRPWTAHLVSAPVRGTDQLPTVQTTVGEAEAIAAGLAAAFIH